MFRYRRLKKRSVNVANWAFKVQKSKMSRNWSFAGSTVVIFLVKTYSESLNSLEKFRIRYPVSKVAHSRITPPMLVRSLYCFWTSVAIMQSVYPIDVSHGTIKIQLVNLGKGPISQQNPDKYFYFYSALYNMLGSVWQSDKYSSVSDIWVLSKVDIVELERWKRIMNIDKLH